MTGCFVVSCVVYAAVATQVFAVLAEVDNDSFAQDNEWQCRGATCANYDICSDISDCGSTCGELRALCRDIMPIESNNCVLPPFPANATYTVNGEQTQPGLLYKTAELELVCPPRYAPDRQDTPVSCRRGKWLGDFPKCTLKEEIFASFNFTSECGQLAPAVKETVFDGSNPQRLPWHAIIYVSTTDPYVQICGGSVITTTAIISVAHCFLNRDPIAKLQPASNFAAAVGKLYRSWNHRLDVHAQKSEISDIKIPEEFQGAATNFKDDIAILKLKTAISYGRYVKPVCLDFDYLLESQQLQVGKMGTITGWFPNAPKSVLLPTLQIISIPYVDTDTCLNNSPESFRKFITSDKMCAGDANGTALCKGSGGNGLTFPHEENGIERHYLRGVVGIAAPSGSMNKFCGDPITAFTQIIKHEYFIKKSVQ